MIFFCFQYDNFLVNLIKYITDLKETEQRIQLGEEQLVALNDNLNISSWTKPVMKPVKLVMKPVSEKKKSFYSFILAFVVYCF